jgi:glutathione S-transferase
VSRLVEDYADEWLWRPAMHYRWSYPETARLMSAWLAEHARDRIAPEWLKRRFWRQRQFGTFVRGDGVDASTRAAVEATYLDTLDALEAVFGRRPFVLGERPTEADFGFFASLFRHFFSDPAPARIMRERAPGVQEWVARMWNLRPERFASLPLPERVPDDLGALFDAIARATCPISKRTRRLRARREARALRGAGHGVRRADQALPRLVSRPARARARGSRQHRARGAGGRVRRERGPGATGRALSEARGRRGRFATAPSGPAAQAVDSWWRS